MPQQDYTISRDAVLVKTNNFTGGKTTRVETGNSWNVIFDLGNNVTTGDRKRPNAHSFTKSTCLPGEWLDQFIYLDSFTPGYSTSYTEVGATYRSTKAVDQAYTFVGADDAALAETFEKIRGGSNLAVDILESGATIRMLRNSLKFRKLALEFVGEVITSRAYRRIPASKTLPGSQARRRADYLSSKWLEYRYGWTPLVLSAYEGLDTALRTYLNNYFVVRGRGRETTIHPSTGGTGSYSNPRYWHTKVATRATELGLMFNIPVNDRGSLYNWTSLNPAGIAWELLPFSFVLDWFVNVGDTLELYENYFLFKNRFIVGYRTRTGKVVTERIWRGDTRGTSGYIFSNHRKVEQNVQVSRWKNREVLTSLPLPSGLRFKVNLNAKRIVDATALTRLLVLNRVR